MELATRDDFLGRFGRVQRRYKSDKLPVSGLAVRIRSLTEGELSGYQRRLLARSGRGLDPIAMASANRKLFVLSLVDANNERLFSDADAEKLIDMDAADASYLYDSIQQHLGVDPQDLGETEKNSEKPKGGSETTHDDSSQSG